MTASRDQIVMEDSHIVYKDSYAAHHLDSENMDPNSYMGMMREPHLKMTVSRVTPGAV